MMVVIDPPRRLAGKMLAEARRLRKTILWHPGVLTRFGIKEFEKDMADLDYLALNEHEAAGFAGKRGLESSVARLAKAAPKARVIVTLGAKGVAFYERGKMTKMESVSLEKLGKAIVNTTGSGDAFVGAFAAERILGKSDSEALKYANMAGALKATKPETRGSPSKKELEEAYRKYFG
jgi:ribokinase